MKQHRQFEPQGERRTRQSRPTPRPGFLANTHARMVTSALSFLIATNEIEFPVTHTQQTTKLFLIATNSPISGAVRSRQSSPANQSTTREFPPHPRLAVTHLGKTQG
jgi:hypothetical protein